MKKSLRFKVFERDKFVCQYCGRRPPEVILHCDHIYPKSKGGMDDELNLITSCADCNLGKKDKIIINLKSKKEITKQIEIAREKEKQLKLYYKFLEKKEYLIRGLVDKISLHWTLLWDCEYSLRSSGEMTIKTFLKFLEPSEIMESMDIARSRINDPEECFKYFCGVVYTKKRSKS